MGGETERERERERERGGEGQREKGHKEMVEVLGGVYWRTLVRWREREEGGREGRKERKKERERENMRSLPPSSLSDPCRES